MEDNITYEQPIKPIRVFSYFNILLLSLLPFFGFIYSLIWSFKPKVDKNRKNLARAMLILQTIFIIILIISILYVWNNVVVPLLSSTNYSVNTYNSNSSLMLENTFNEVKNTNIDGFDYFQGFQSIDFNTLY